MAVLNYMLPCNKCIPSMHNFQQLSDFLILKFYEGMLRCNIFSGPSYTPPYGDVPRSVYQDVKPPCQTGPEICDFRALFGLHNDLLGLNCRTGLRLCQLCFVVNFLICRIMIRVFKQVLIDQFIKFITISSKHKKKKGKDTETEESRQPIYNSKIS